MKAIVILLYLILIFGALFCFHYYLHILLKKRFQNNDNDLQQTMGTIVTEIPEDAVVIDID
jgi:hypothetical protein